MDPRLVDDPRIRYVTDLPGLSDSFVWDLIVAIVGPVRDLFGETVGLLLGVSLAVALPIILTIVFYKMILRWGQFFPTRMGYPALIGWLALGVFGGGMGRLLCSSLLIAFFIAMAWGKRR